MFRRMPQVVRRNALDRWGSVREAFGAEVRAAYIDALRDPARVHAICEEYRALGGIGRFGESTD